MAVIICSMTAGFVNTLDAFCSRYTISRYIDIVKYIPHPDTLRISLVIVDGELHLDHGLIVRHRDGDLRDGAGGGGCPGCQQHEAQGSQWSWQHDYSTAAQFDDLWSRVSGIRDVILI